MQLDRRCQFLKSCFVNFKSFIANLRSLLVSLLFWCQILLFSEDWINQTLGWCVFWKDHDWLWNICFLLCWLLCVQPRWWSWSLQLTLASFWRKCCGRSRSLRIDGWFESALLCNVSLFLFLAEPQDQIFVVLIENLVKPICCVYKFFSVKWFAKILELLNKWLKHCLHFFWE